MAKEKRKIPHDLKDYKRSEPVDAVDLAEEQLFQLSVTGNLVFKAVQEGNFGVVEELIKSGANVNAKNGSHGTALHEAVRQGNIGIIELLLENKANINEYDGNGQSALDLAILAGDIEIIDKLLSKPGIISESIMRQALSTVFQRNDGPTTTLDEDAIIKKLLGYQDEYYPGRKAIDATDYYANPLIYYACIQGKSNLVKKLLDYGAKVPLESLKKTKASMEQGIIIANKADEELMELLKDKKVEVEKIKTQVHDAKVEENLASETCKALKGLGGLDSLAFKDSNGLGEGLKGGLKALNGEDLKDALKILEALQDSKASKASEALKCLEDLECLEASKASEVLKLEQDLKKSTAWQAELAEEHKQISKCLQVVEDYEKGASSGSIGDTQGLGASEEQVLGASESTAHVESAAPVELAGGLPHDLHADPHID